MNIQKARHSMYMLMPAGLHGENGLDPQTAVRVFVVADCFVVVFFRYTCYPYCCLV